MVMKLFLHEPTADELDQASRIQPGELGEKGTRDDGLTFASGLFAAIYTVAILAMWLTAVTVGSKPIGILIAATLEIIILDGLAYMVFGRQELPMPMIGGMQGRVPDSYLKLGGFFYLLLSVAVFAFVFLQ